MNEEEWGVEVDVLVAVETARDGVKFCGVHYCEVRGGVTDVYGRPIYVCPACDILLVES